MKSKSIVVVMQHSMSRAVAITKPHGSTAIAILFGVLPPLLLIYAVYRNATSSYPVVW